MRSEERVTAVGRPRSVLQRARDETLEPSPAYLGGVARLPRAVRRLFEAGDRRPLTADEEQRIALAIAAACLRVLDARRRRDGKA